jgi:hypothetical protein
MRVLLAVLLAIPSMGQQFTISTLERQPLTNGNIVTLAKAGFDELFILELIRSSRTSFDTSVPALVVLKESGVSEDLIRLMAMPLAPTAETPPPKATPKKHSFGPPWKHPSN